MSQIDRQIQLERGLSEMVWMLEGILTNAEGMHDESELLLTHEGRVRACVWPITGLPICIDKLRGLLDNAKRALNHRKVVMTHKRGQTHEPINLLSVTRYQVTFYDTKQPTDEAVEAAVAEAAAAYGLAVTPDVELIVTVHYIVVPEQYYVVTIGGVTDSPRHPDESPF